MCTTLETILNTKIIAISRGTYDEPLINAALALYEGGVRAIEVTFEQNLPISRTTDAIGRLADALPTGACIGVGTVLTKEQVKAAKSTGAKFIISPNIDKEIISLTKELDMVSIPGAMTPSEIVAAKNFGADIVKVFPAGVLGIDYFKSVRAPLCHIPMAAVAGITEENITDFANAGAVAFGISTALFNKRNIVEEKFDRITEAANRFIMAVG